MSEGTGQIIRYLDRQERQLSRELWEEAFPEDSKSFDDYYFEEKIKDNRILVLEEDGRIDSMIQLNPYLLQVKGLRWRVDYLVGVATREDRRHRGYMRRLLARMMADMQSEEMPFCFLMPADEAIYRPFGYTYIYRQPCFGWKDVSGLERRELLPWKDSLGNRRYLQLLAGWMNDWLQKRYQVYAVRDLDYLQRLMKEIASENGSLDVLYDKDMMVGIESQWGWENKELRLLYGEASYVEEVTEPKPAIMARIITVEQFVRVIRLKDTVQEEERTLLLCLEDPLIAENQGLWKWNLNHETSWLERVEARKNFKAEEISGAFGLQDAGVLHLNITELTGWLFGYEIPECAMAYADVVETLQDVFLDEIV